MKKSSKMTKCKVCGREVAKGAKACPGCGKDPRNFFSKHKILTVILIFFVIGLIGMVGSPGTDTTDTSTGNDVAVEEKEDKKVDEDVPSEYKSALNKAESYSETMYMSKDSIYDQLISEYGEQFSEEAAQYAMDNLEADWNRNALEKAKSYRDMDMSKDGIYDQLISEYGEKFTEEQAKYAVDNLKVDWNKNALGKAKSYQDMDMSPDAIYDQLISEYGEKFTEEQAKYAVDHLK